MPAPYRPRHRRSKASCGPLSASDALFAAGALATLLLVLLVAGGLLAGPF